MATLLSILKQQVIPHVAGATAPSLIVAGGPLDGTALPEGVTLSPRKLKGVRKPVKGPREYGNHSLVAARWNQEHLIEIPNAAKLFFVVGGQADMQLGEALIRCGPGHFVLIPPGTAHSDGTRPHLEGARRETPGERCDLLWFMPLNRGVHCWMCHSKSAWHGKSDVAGYNQHGHARGEDWFVPTGLGAEVLNSLCEEAQAGKAHHKEICAGLLQSLLFLLQREMEAGNVLRAKRAMEEASLVPLDGDPIDMARRYIQNHLEERLTIEKVARHCLMSQTRFTQLFRKKTGQSFLDFVTLCRLEEAKVLLQESEWSVARISVCVGLRSPAYLAELFQRNLQMSPTAYRQEVAGKAEGNRIKAEA